MPGDPSGDDHLRVDCPCGTVFHVPRSLGGGLSNCPACRQANKVPAAGVEWLFAALVGGGIVAVLFVTAVAWAAGGWIAGLIALAVGGAILAACIAAS